MEQESKSMTLDTILYIFAKVIEGIIGVITVTAYTYCFIPEDYGKYNIINLTVVTSSMIIINWLVQAIMRYINEYESDEDCFYSTIFFVWLKIILVSIIIAGLFIILYTNLFESSKLMLWLGLIMFVTYSTNLICTNILVVKRRIKLNLGLSLVSSILKLVMTLLLIKLFGSKIEWILIPNIIFDAVYVFITVYKLDIIKHISYSKNSNNVLKKFKEYGIPIIGLTVSTAILNNSDRYIIRIIINSSAVGIYYANYSLISAAFSMLSNAIMKGSYPAILKAWNEHNKTKTLNLISQAVRHFLLLAMPAIAGISVLAQKFAQIVLDVDYVEGYTVMKWIAIGMTFSALTEYSNKYWELKENTKVIFIYSLISGIINIFLNIILIPLAGYKVAAITTTISFFIYFMLSFCSSYHYFKWNLKFINYARILLSSIFMVIVIKILLNILPASFSYIIFIILLAVAVYFICLWITGEIKGEIEILKSILRKGDINEKNN